MDVKVKICGLTNLADARGAVKAGADLLGFIFFPKSPRYVTPEEVRNILNALEPGRAGVLTVGVFVNETPETVAQVIDFCGLDVAQLHGEEPSDQLGLEDGSPYPGPSPLRGRAFKALRPRSLEEGAASAQHYALPAHLRQGGRLPALLVDAYHPDLRGGTGEVGDWRLAAALANRHPLLLAGGLNPGNVAQAVQRVQPWGVDVASGVESSPGYKDHAALRAFVTAAKSVTFREVLNFPEGHSHEAERRSAT
jgi:phosphoribosylanthranilate isomerase